MKKQIESLSTMLKKMVADGHKRADYTLGTRVYIK